MKINRDALQIHNSLNPELQRMHRVFIFFYGILWCLFGFLSIFIIYGSIFTEKPTEIDLSAIPAIIFANIILSSLFFAHWYAAKGARFGKSYGRTASKTLALAWLISIKFAIIALYCFYLASDKKWKYSEPTESIG